MRNTLIMHWRTLTIVTLLVAGISLAGCQSVGQPVARSMGMVPMGSKQDVADADKLWAALKRANLVGPTAMKKKPYKGQPPHGAVLETLSKNITVDGHTGLAIIKRNYGGPGVSISSVGKNRKQYLKAVTVMFKRKAGYDNDNKDWFWAKYKPNGGLHTKDNMGMKIALAGRVAKGKPKGCISCHKGAPGGDYVFASNISTR